MSARGQHTHRPIRVSRIQQGGEFYRALLCGECGDWYNLTPWADRPNPRGKGPRDHDS